MKEQGFAHILIVVLLLLGLAVAVFLVQQKTNIFPKAYESVDDSINSIQITSKRVFVTSTTYNGNLGGLDGADAKCQARTDAANLGGEWKAWLSDDTASAGGRLIHSNGPYKRLDNIVVANNWDELTGGVLQNPIEVTELGSRVEGKIWTGTMPNGNGINYYIRRSCANNNIKPCDMNWTCLNWTDESYGNIDELFYNQSKSENLFQKIFWENSVIGLIGKNSTPEKGYEGEWTGQFRSNYSYCGAKNHLYCFEQ